MLEVMSGDCMKCTWYLIKRYGIVHKWAFKAAREIAKLPGRWDWVVRKPDSPPLVWSYKNKLRFMDYLECCKKYDSKLGSNPVIDIAISRLKKSMQEDTRFCLQDLADLAKGEVLFMVFEYYAASRGYQDTGILDKIIKETNRTGTEIHIPSWGDE